MSEEARNFKDHPKSVGELKSDKTTNAKDWEPRDALISLLRDIDDGTREVDGLIVIYRIPNKEDPNNPFVGTSYAKVNKIDSLGLLAWAQYIAAEED